MGVGGSRGTAGSGEQARRSRGWSPGQGPSGLTAGAGRSRAEEGMGGPGRAPPAWRAKGEPDQGWTAWEGDTHRPADV